MAFVFRINERLVAVYGAGRILLAGDAAHVLGIHGARRAACRGSRAVVSGLITGRRVRALLAFLHRREDAQRFVNASAIVDRVVHLPFADGGIRLVRPDGYVGVVARTRDWQTLTSYLNSCLVSANRSCWPLPAPARC